MTITVITEQCPQNHPCPAVSVCPVKALKQKHFLAPVVDGDLCTGCGKCARFCPRGALQMER